MMRAFFANFLTLGILFAFSSQVLSAAEFVPLINAELLGGQYYFQGEKSSFGGNLNLNLAGAIKFNPRVTMLPTYYISYRKTKEVTELVGGGTLYQQAQTHSLFLKGIYKVNNSLKLKLKAGNSWEFLRETVDEQWGKGLFDYRKASAGMEVEKAFSQSQLSLIGGYDYYTFIFPNYTSLAAQYGSELAGKNVLDFFANQVYGQLHYLILDKLFSKFEYNYSQKKFFDQKIVTESGEYTSSKRRDNSHLTNLDFSYLLPSSAMTKITFQTIFDGQFYFSDQNHYDAQKFQFISGYYDYQELGINPVINFYWKESYLFLQYRYAKRNYSERLVQNASGDYQSDKIYIRAKLFGAGLTYPVTKNFSLKFLISKLISQSNMQYEAVYRYNYDTYNYFLGIAFEY